MSYWLAFILAVVVAYGATPLVMRLSKRLGVYDQPGGRKIHTRPVARLGGLAIALSFITLVLVFLPISRQLLGLLGGVVILVTVGALDDKFDLSPWVKLGWQIVAALVALGGGIGVQAVTNPFGGTILLDWGRFAVNYGPLHFHVTPLGNLLTILWMVGVINAINFLDGLDGLAAGVSSIAAAIMFLVAVSPHIRQPEVAMLAIIVCGATLGFLPFNFFPAKIFMGDSGSYFLGLVLSLLAIYSGAKLATATLVLGLPIIDSLWAVLRRLYHKTSPFKPDRGHLHHMMLDAGLTQRQSVAIFYAISATFGLIAVFAGTSGKLVALVAMVLFIWLLMTRLLLVSVTRQRRSATGKL